jgi:mxaK protein
MIAGLARIARRGRGPILVLLLTATVAVAAWRGWLLHRAAQDNRAIADLARGVDTAVSADASPDLLLARANFLLGQGRLEEAQGLGDLPALRTAPRHRAAIYYNLANARLRNAVPMLSRQQTDRALSLISLATEEYRQALRLAPDDWDIRYNFDAAMRLVNASPRLQLQQEGELERQPSPKQSWTDLPSLPKGLP